MNKELIEEIQKLAKYYNICQNISINDFNYYIDEFSRKINCRILFFTKYTLTIAYT